MKVGEWNNLGRARGLLQRQLGDLGAAEEAAHVAVNPDNGRLRILVATDIGLLDYSYMPVGANPEGDWILRGQLQRWSAVKGLRLQSDAQLESDDSDEVKYIWRLVAEEPKVDLAVTSDTPGERPADALLAFARACLSRVV